MSQRPTAIELFAGCGGLSTGLLDAGYDVRLGVDIDAPSIVAFDHNHSYRGTRSIRADVAELTGAMLLEAAGLKSLDLLAGGPPCQPFSVAGKRLGLSDPRGHLIAEFVRLAGEIRPRVVLLENVPALQTSHNGDVVRATKAELEELGYVVRWEILNAADYGVPQARKRLILVAVRDVVDFAYPPATTHSATGDDGKRPYLTAKDALQDLPDVLSKEAESIPNHEPTAHSPSMLATFALLEPGKRDPRSRHDRLHPGRPGYTLRAGSGNFSPMRPIHYSYDRVVSVRESARLQGFDDSFIWPDSLSRLQQYRQVGNAVPPPLAQAVGEHIAEILGWHLDPAASAGIADTRPNALTLTPAQRAERRARYHRGGASFGKAIPATHAG
ncbi:DNA cytosine methyltransferase [Microbacterium sp. zg.Y909]|uniref:DNA cytosine methyltransferase n=1 Tax=Microbacterium sp. zg.Y909 TaxID=2969413 RepID=UPI00214C0F2E|nr:DNA cytosine methyltransferase [Microbacterium sp. zg.Y909]MCR2825373.1 DNA cytosine methyltransferase [Microbacterium sp. zg.Y909]